MGDACEANKQNYLHMMRPAFYDEAALDDMEAQWARLQEGKKKKSDGITPVSPWGKELMTWGNHAKKKGVGPYCIPVEVDNENEGEISRVGKEHWLTVAGLKHLLFTVLKGGEVELTPDLHWVMKQMLRAYFLERETLLSLKATERTKEQERRAGELLALASSTESALQFVCKLLRQVFAVGKKHSMTQDVLQTMETLKAQRDLEECTSSVNAVARQIADLMGKMPVASAPASEKKAKKPVPESSPFWSNLATLAHRTKLQELLCTESSSPDSPPLPASALANFIEAKMVAIRPIGFRCLARIEAFLKAAGPKLNNLEGGNSVTKKEYAKVDGNLNQARAMMRPLRDEPALARLRRCLERLKPLIGPAAKGQTAALTTLKAEISAAGKRLNGRDKTEADGTNELKSLCSDELFELVTGIEKSLKEFKERPSGNASDDDSASEDHEDDDSETGIHDADVEGAVADQGGELMRSAKRPRPVDGDEGTEPEKRHALVSRSPATPSSSGDRTPTSMELDGEEEDEEV